MNLPRTELKQGQAEVSAFKVVKVVCCYPLLRFSLKVRIDHSVTGIAVCELI